MRKSLCTGWEKLWASRGLYTVVYFTSLGLFKNRVFIRGGLTVFTPSFAQPRLAFSRVVYGLSPVSTALFKETTN